MPHAGGQVGGDAESSQGVEPHAGELPTVHVCMCPTVHVCVCPTAHACVCPTVHVCVYVGFDQLVLLSSTYIPLHPLTPPHTPLQLVLLSSTHNGHCVNPPRNASVPWEVQVQSDGRGCSWAAEIRTYEAVRQAVLALKHARVSYVPLHTLAAVDRCGFSTRFPARVYARGPAAHKAGVGTLQDCHAGWGIADPHLHGGAYLHLLELLLLVLRTQRRLCDPSAHEDAESPPGFASLLGRFVQHMPAKMQSKHAL